MHSTTEGINIERNERVASSANAYRLRKGSIAKILASRSSGKSVISIAGGLSLLDPHERSIAVQSAAWSS